MYIPAPSKIPDWMTKRIRDEGGVIEDGRPAFRVVWSNDRMAMVGGKWNKFDGSGNITGSTIETRLMPKYVQAPNRWIVEQYVPPEMDEEQWIALTVKNIDGLMIETLGPYMPNGDYELLKILQTPCRCEANCEDPLRHNAYVPLTSTIMDAIIHVARINKQIPKQDRLAYQKRKREREEAAKENRLDSAISSISRPKWALNPHVVLSEMKERKQ
jgi:hypothetical protein